MADFGKTQAVEYTADKLTPASGWQWMKPDVVGSRVVAF
jgi:hypothetical protein